ncbi:alcohol dehydrogenase [Planctomycetales bacterium]|nr:alcohol dehydrogenase [Planctomycetales bacterium]
MFRVIRDLNNPNLGKTIILGHAQTWSLTMIPFYELILPKRILFGVGKRRDIGTAAKPFGHRAVIVYGSRTLETNGEIRKLVKCLENAGISVLTTENIAHEPEVSDVDNIVERLRSSILPGDFIIGFGGGSAIDLAKAIAALLPQPSAVSVLEYLEGVGSGMTINEPPLPIVAVPTTAGTGAEATKNAVIASYHPLFKKSLRDNALIPGLVIADPELTLSCPKQITAASGMDAVTQLIESYVSKKHQPVTDALVEQALPVAVRALTVLGSNNADGNGIVAARCGMMHAAMISGITLANAGLGMAHGIAPALGTHCRIPHGTACALLLPVALRVNADVCLARYGNLGRLVTGNAALTDEQATERLIAEIVELCKLLDLPQSLRQIGVRDEMFPVLARDSKGSSMSGNPKELSESDVENILRSIA